MTDYFIDTHVSMNLGLTKKPYYKHLKHIRIERKANQIVMSSFYLKMHVYLLI